MGTIDANALPPSILGDLICADCLYHDKGHCLWWPLHIHRDLRVLTTECNNAAGCAGLELTPGAEGNVRLALKELGQ